MSPIVSAQGLVKRFRGPQKAPGLAGAVRHLLRPRHETVTAVDGVDLRIDEGESVAYVAVKARLREFVGSMRGRRGLTVLEWRWWTLPVLVMTDYPSRLLLGVGEARGWWAATPAIAAAVAALVASMVWHRGLNRYQGVGN